MWVVPLAVGVVVGVVTGIALGYTDPKGNYWGHAFSGGLVGYFLGWGLDTIGVPGFDNWMGVAILSAIFTAGSSFFVALVRGKIQLPPEE